MTDNEIIEALEKILELMCREGDLQRASTIGNALDLINRKDAEIERLKNECFCLANERDAYKDVLDTAVSEARKEFAERLKEKSKKRVSDIYGKRIFIEDIDNLLEEMESESNV